MHPELMWWQAGPIVPLTVLVSMTPMWYIASIILGMLFFWWIFLDARYATDLGEKDRSPNRTKRDHFVAAQILIVSLVGVACGALANYSSIARWGLEAGGATGAALVTFVVILGSSLVDCYYVRPRIDGVVWRPPCHTSGDSCWSRVTRIWFFHRVVAWFLCAFGVVATIFMMLLWVAAGAGLDSASQKWGLVAAVLVPCLGLLSYVFKDEYGNLGQAVVQAKDGAHYRVGDHVVLKTGEKGYIREIAVNQLMLVDPPTHRRFQVFLFFEHSS